MKSAFTIAVLLLLNVTIAIGQETERDNLRRQLKQVRPDTNGVVLLNTLAAIYRFNKPDSAVLLIQQALDLSRKLNFARGEARALSAYGEALRFRG
jgi:hypothetical protein